MAIQEKLYTVDDLWAMESDPEFEHRKFYLIDGELYEDDVPGRIHALLAIEIGFYLRLYAAENRLGEATSECGFHPPEKRHTALLPDVAFQRFDKLPDPPPEGYVPRMPDLAVEIQSPSDSLSKMRQKARAYLDNGTSVVWLVQPARRGVEVCRLGEDGAIHTEFKRQGDLLGGYDFMPGFELAVNKLFPPGK